MIPRVIVPEDLEIILIGIYSWTNFAFCGVVEVRTADVALGIEPDAIHVENEVLRPWSSLGHG